MFDKLRQMFSLPDLETRGEVRVGRDDWHYRRYLKWNGYTGGNRPGYRENFCHYWRVVLVWGSMLWFFSEPVYKQIRPWMITAVLSLLALTGYGLWVNPYEAFRVILLTLVILAGMVLICLGVFLASYMSENRDKRWVKMFVRLSVPIWGPIVLLFKGLSKLMYAKSIDRLFNWYFKTYKWYVVAPWTVTLAMMPALSAIFVGIEETLQFLLLLSVVTLGLAGLVALTAVFVVFLPELIKKFRNRRVRVVSGTPEHHGISTFTLIRYIIAFKGKVCPYMVLPEDQMV